MYEFGKDVGGLERSKYFGYSKDLYHFDHFMGEHHCWHMQCTQWECMETTQCVASCQVVCDRVAAAGEFSNKFQDIIDHAGFHVQPAKDGGNDTKLVTATVTTKQGEQHSVEFTMKIKDVGRNRGCWMTATIKRL
jgi:hypothetical protein